MTGTLAQLEPGSQRQAQVLASAASAGFGHGLHCTSARSLLKVPACNDYLGPALIEGVALFAVVVAMITKQYRKACNGCCRH